MPRVDMSKAQFQFLSSHQSEMGLPRPKFMQIQTAQASNNHQHLMINIVSDAPAVPTNGIVVVPDIEELQTQLQCAGHTLLAGVARNLYLSLSNLVPNVLCPKSTSLCGAALSFGFEAPLPSTALVGPCETTSTNSTPGWMNEACSVLQCAMAPGKHKVLVEVYGRT